ncbi:hypothetical protein A2U01_0108562, partial [Trifolium medium]|nr:hypothetical protein [Trifolium medium]
RFQRKKKLATQKVSAGGNATAVQKVELAKRPSKERFAPIVEEAEAENGKGAENEEDYMDGDDLLDDEPYF